MSSDAPKYSCGSCHRSYTWKKEVAGKRGKCKCGQVITVPLYAPQAEPVDDLYALAELSSDARSAVIDPTPIVVPTAAIAAAAPEALEYQRPAKTTQTSRSERVDPLTGEFSDPFRDYITPAILLTAGLAGIAVYMMQKMGTGPLVSFAISIAFAIMLVITLVKTVVLTLAAFPLATSCDVNLGLLRTAILKFAGTILFGDIAILWLVVLLRFEGVIASRSRSNGGLGFWLIYALVLAVIYQFCFGYVFRLSAADFRFAWRMAAVSRLCDFFMTLAVIALFTSLAASHARPTASPYVPAIQTPPTISPGTPLTVQPGQTGPTVNDELISQEISRNPFHIQEGYAWCRTGAADDADKKLISDMYGAGAAKVSMNGFTMYALLPDDPAKRTACLNVASAFRIANGIPDNSSMNYQYAVINLLGERLKGLHHKN
jgi:hypothetical protein